MPKEAAAEFYVHDQHWSNRMILDEAQPHRGTGLAGYRHDQVAPMFAAGLTLANLQFPIEWRGLF